MITAFIPTYNCEKTIRASLESIKWVDKILIVDSFSTDGTIKICSEYTSWIIQHEYIYSSKQKNWALEQIDSEWTLHIDSDEQIDVDLKNEIVSIMTKENLPDGFRIRLKNYIWGKWIKSCNLYPCAQIRLFRTKKGKWSDRQVHAKLEGLNIIVDLNNHIIHQDLTDISEELQQFSRQVMLWEANELIKKNRQWHWSDVTLRPLAIFFVYYIKLGGFFDGFRGFYISVFKAYYSFMTYSKLFEIQQNNNDQIL